MAELVDDVWRNMNNLVEKTYKTEEVRELVEKIRNGVDLWFTFLTALGIPPTNCGVG
jgi:LPS sulfotransferase NodH